MKFNQKASLLVGLFLLLPFLGCSSSAVKQKSYYGSRGSKKVRHTHTKECGKPRSLWDIQEWEAKLSDIPTSLAFEQLYNTEPGVLIYQAIQPAEEVAAFYREEMPLYNWRLASQHVGKEIVLVFIKGERVCVVSITHTRSKSESHIALMLSYLTNS